MSNRMTIAQKLGLGFALLLLLFVVSGLVVDGVVKDVSDRLAHLRGVEEPTSEAAYEMEINAIGSGLSVLKYLDTQRTRTSAGRCARTGRPRAQQGPLR